MTLVVGVLAALLSFGFIVFIHEMGHFLAARWAGIRAPYFAIGFGPRLFAFMHKGTEFSVRLFPLGGYVLMVGEDPGVDSGDSWHRAFHETVGEVEFPTTPARVLENLAQPNPEVETFLRSLPPDRLYHKMGDLEGNFNDKSTFQKTIVILGGVTMNFIAATLLLLGLGFTKGLGVPLQDALPRAKEVFPDTPAARAGIQSEDTIVSLDGDPVVSGPDFIELMTDKAGKKVRLQIRDGSRKERTVEVVPDLAVGANFFQQSGSEVHLIRTEADKPSKIQLPYVVKSVNGKPLSSLVELKAIALNPKELLLDGPQGPWKLQSAEGFHPRGVVGMRLAQVTSFDFEKVATSDVVGVLPGSLAQRSGVQVGDWIVDIQGLNVGGGRKQLTDVLGKLASRPLPPGKSLELIVMRDGKDETLHLNEAPGPTPEAFGVELQPITAGVVVKKTFFILGRIASIPKELAQGFITNLAGTFKMLKSESTGPLGIMQQIYEVSDEGLPELLFLVAILNAFIATFNLMPIPALDGSRILFIWVGALRGRPLDPEKEARIHFLGIVVLLSIALLVSIQDVQRLWAGTPLMK
jgi:membrane-associated protease RseP (regulator of RpoE activity)